jgi:hypothetical protein
MSEKMALVRYVVVIDYDEDGIRGLTHLAIINAVSAEDALDFILGQLSRRAEVKATYACPVEAMDDPDRVVDPSHAAVDGAYFDLAAYRKLLLEKLAPLVEAVDNAFVGKLAIGKDVISDAVSFDPDEDVMEPASGITFGQIVAAREAIRILRGGE